MGMDPVIQTTKCRLEERKSLPLEETKNSKLSERPLPEDGNLPSKRSNYSNIKDVIFNPASKLTIYRQNVRGLGNKMGEFETHILPLLPQVICLTEHHLTLYIPN